MSNVEKLVFAVAMLIVGLLVAFKPNSKTETHDEIISHHCAQYNATTGDFEWLDTITKPQEPTQ